MARWCRERSRMGYWPNRDGVGTSYALSCWVYIPSAYSTVNDGMPELDCDISSLGTGGVAVIGSADTTKRDQWQRIVTTFNVGTGGGTAINMLFRRGNQVAGAINGGSTFYSTCPQMEVGSFPTSYIPTTSAAVTRARDTPGIVNGPWRTPPGGSWFAEFVRLNPLGTGLLRVIGNSLNTAGHPVIHQ